MSVATDKTIKLLFVCFLILNVSFWFYARDFKARWNNVPPVPSEIGLRAFALGDRQFAYRMIGIMLQNLGDTGGRSTALKEYDYNSLTRWFFLTRTLDAQSDFIPVLVSLYFGSVNDPEKLRPLLNYLEVAGNSPEGQKWRWLAQGIYLARFKMNDQDRALELARILAGIDNASMPAWTRQMPAFILNAKGNKEEALAIMIEILKSSADKIHPNEVNFTREYICTRILDEKEAQGHPLCQNTP